MPSETVGRGSPFFNSALLHLADSQHGFDGVPSLGIGNGLVDVAEVIELLKAIERKLPCPAQNGGLNLVHWPRRNGESMFSSSPAPYQMVGSKNIHFFVVLPNYRQLKSWTADREIQSEQSGSGRDIILKIRSRARPCGHCHREFAERHSSEAVFPRHQDLKVRIERNLS